VDLLEIIQWLFVAIRTGKYSYKGGKFLGKHFKRKEEKPNDKEAS
jgi:hypothetical protein